MGLSVKHFGFGMIVAAGSGQKQQGEPFAAVEGNIAAQRTVHKVSAFVADGRLEAGVDVGRTAKRADAGSRGVHDRSVGFDRVELGASFGKGNCLAGETVENEQHNRQESETGFCLIGCHLWLVYKVWMKRFILSNSSECKVTPNFKKCKIIRKKFWSYSFLQKKVTPRKGGVTFKFSRSNPTLRRGS